MSSGAQEQVRPGRIQRRKLPRGWNLGAPGLQSQRYAVSHLDVEAAPDHLDFKSAFLLCVVSCSGASLRKERSKLYHHCQ